MNILETEIEPVAKANHPLMERLVNECNAQWLGLDNLDAYLASDEGLTVLLIAGDHIRFPEGLDVAVILPELLKTFPNQCRVGIIQSADEDAIAKKYAAHSRPSLVFVRGTKYVTTIVGMLDWDVFVQQFEKALNAPTQRVPIMMSAVGGASSCA